MPNSTEEERRRRRGDAESISVLVDEFNSGIVDGLVDDNTLVFDTESDEELRRLVEEQEKAEIEMTNTAKKDAQELIDSALQLYAKKTGDIDYVRFKSKSDINTFTKILYQIEVNEDAIRMIMRELKTGGVNANLLRNLSDLQKTEIELWRMKSQYLTSMEESLKQVTSDVELDNAVEVESGEEAQTAKSRSSRDLMKMLDNAQKGILNQEDEKNDNLF